MTYAICSAPWMFQCTSLVLHVVHMMSYILAYWELLLFFMVGLAMCVYSQIIQRYVCKLIVGDEILIAGVYSELLLFDVVICPTIGGGSFHLHYRVLI